MYFHFLAYILFLLYPISTFRAVLSGYFCYELNVSVYVQTVCFILYPFLSQSLVQAVCLGSVQVVCFLYMLFAKPTSKQPVRDLSARSVLKTLISREEILFQVVDILRPAQKP